MPRSCSIHPNVPRHHTDTVHAYPNHPYSTKSPCSGAERPVLVTRNHPALVASNWVMTTSGGLVVAARAAGLVRLFSCRPAPESDILLSRLRRLLGLLLRRPCSLKEKEFVVVKYNANMAAGRQAQNLALSPSILVKIPEIGIYAYYKSTLQSTKCLTHKKLSTYNY